MRLIDADALKKEAKTSRETTDAFIELIDKAPTVDEHTEMTEKETLCNGCEHKENCNMYKKNPDVKVIDCQQFKESKKMQEILRGIAMFAIHGDD